MSHENIVSHLFQTVYPPFFSISYLCHFIVFVHLMPLLLHVHSVLDHGMLLELIFQQVTFIELLFTFFNV